MNFRKSIVLAAVAVACSLVSLGLSRQHSGQHQITVPDKAFTLPADEVISIQLSRAGEDLPYAVFDREDSGRWKVAFPARGISDFANRRTIDELLALIKIGRVKKVSDVSLAQSQIFKDGSLQITAYDADRKNESIYIGAVDPTAKHRYVATEADRDTVRRMPINLLRTLERPEVNFRQLELIDLQAEKLSEIALYPNGKPGESGPPIVMTETKTGWFIREPVQWPLDDFALQRMLRLIQGLQANSIVAEGVTELKKYGLDATAPHIVLTLDGKKAVVRFGREAENDETVYAWREGRQQVYTISRAFKAALLQGQKNPHWVQGYRQSMVGILAEAPTIIRVKSAIGTLDLTRQAGAWQASGARSWAVNQAAVKKLLLLLRRLKITRFASEDGSDLAAYGLLTPLLTISGLDAANRVTGKIIFSRPNKQGYMYFKIDGQPNILQVHQFHAALLQNIPLGLRSVRLTSFDYNAIKNITITDPTRNPAQKGYAKVGRFWRDSTNGGKRLLSPEDEIKLAKVAIICSRLSATSFVAENVSDLAKFGLDHPQLYVVVKADSGQVGEVLLSLEIGKLIQAKRRVQSGKQKKQYFHYAKIKGKNAVFTLPEKIVQLLRTKF